jgi:hydroxypyruvate isomerase
MLRADFMDRRDFTRTIARAVLGAAALPSIPALASAGDVPFKLSVMLWTIYTSLPFEQRLEKVSEAGYHAVELVGEFKNWSEDDFRRVNARKRSLGITFDCTAGLSKGIADPAGREAFLAELKNFFPLAAKLECPTIIVMSGDRISGISHEAHHNACVEALKVAGDLAAKQNFTLLLENIDQEENPRYFLTSVAEGFEIVRKVDNPHVRFLYDFYHEQISEGNLIEKLVKNIDLVGLVHIADVPGRNQPGTGEINYNNIFRKLAELKYDRYAAMEFKPAGDPVAVLRQAREQVARAVAAA